MPSKPENVDQRVADGAKYLLQSTKYSEPWWHGSGNNTIAGEDATKTSSAEYLNVTVTSGGTQSQANGTVMIHDDGKINLRCLSVKYMSMVWIC